MQYILFFIFFSFSVVFFAQTTPDNKSNFWDNTQFGGGLNLNFSNGYTVIGISPSALYNFSDQFASGVSISYLYVKNRLVPEPLNVYGTSVLARYQPTETIQISTEFEQNFLKQGNATKTIPALYFGAGYNLSPNVGAGFRYDVLYDKDNSFYPSAITPFIKVYF